MLPAEEQADLRSEQERLHNEYAALPPALDEHRREEQQAQAVIDGVAPRLAKLREEVAELEGKLHNAELVLTEAQTQAQAIQDRMDRMVSRDLEITERLKELAKTVDTPAPTAKAAPTGGNTALLDAAERFQQFSARDLAAVLKMTPRATKAAIDIHVKEGRIRDTGRKVMGQLMYEHVAALEDRDEEDAESLRIVRDFCVSMQEPFPRGAIEEATDVGGPLLTEHLQTLIRRGVIEYVGFDDLELYQYVKPTDMGDAAKRDIARRKELAKSENGSGGRSAPVEGTGGGLTIGNADVRALVQDIIRAGGQVRHESRGGHLVVTYGKKRISISSTPSSRRSVLNDRARARRELQINI